MSEEAERACWLGERIVLFKKAKGSDRKIGSDIVGHAPSWRVEAKTPHGSFYARQKRMMLTFFEPDGPAEICTAASSKVLSRSSRISRDSERGR